jgi:hypothetical protein
MHESLLPSAEVPITIDDWFARISDVAPGFAGMYLEEGNIVIRTTGASAETDVRNAIRSIDAAARFRGFAQADAGNRIRFVRADYDHRSLLEWRRLAMSVQSGGAGFAANAVVASFILTWYPPRPGAFFLRFGLGRMYWMEGWESVAIMCVDSCDFTETAPAGSLGLGYGLRVGSNLSLMPYLNDFATSSVGAKPRLGGSMAGGTTSSRSGSSYPPTERGSHRTRDHTTAPGSVTGTQSRQAWQMTALRTAASRVPG